MIKLVFVSLSVVACLAAVGWWIGSDRGPEWVDEVLPFCAAINLIACWLSFAPLALVRRSKPEYIPQAALGGVVIRLLIVGSATIAAMTFAPWPTGPLSLWMILFYLALLGVETTFAVRVMNSTQDSRGRVSV